MRSFRRHEYCQSGSEAGVETGIITMILFDRVYEQIALPDVLLRGNTFTDKWWPDPFETKTLKLDTNSC